MNKSILGTALVMVLTGCSTVSQIGMISNGNLEGKTFSGVQRGDVIEGESCGHTHSLAWAFDKATQGTQYDTMIDAEVESTTDLFAFGNCIKLKGYGVNSMNLAEGK